MANYIDPKGFMPKKGKKPWVVGSSEAPRVHGFNQNSKYNSAPRFKNQFFVHFQFRPQVNFSGGLETLKGVSYKVISFDAPKFEIQNETLMQYNKRRIIPTQIQFSPCNVTWHDTKDAQVQNFWKFVYEFYFKDGRMKTPGQYEKSASTKIVEGTNAGAIKDPLPHNYFGYHLGNKEEYPNLFSSISLYLVANLKYTRIDLVNPYLQAFNHDSLSQEDPNSLMTLTATFQPETVVYVAENKSLVTTDQYNGTLQGLMGMSDQNKAIFNHYSYDDTIPDPTDITTNEYNIVNSSASAAEFKNFTGSQPKKRLHEEIESFPGSQPKKRLPSDGPDRFIGSALDASPKDYMQWWHAGDVEAVEIILKNVGGSVAVDDFSFLTEALSNLFQGTKPPQHMEKLANSLQTAVATSPSVASDEIVKANPLQKREEIDTDALEVANVDAFDELNGDLATVSEAGSVPSEKSTDALKTAVQNVQKGAPGAVGQALSNSLSYGGGSVAVKVSGARASLMGGTVPSYNSPGLSNIGFGSLLPSGMSGLNQTLQTLGTIASVINVVAGGNSFGKFSTGASTLANVAQGLSTGNLRQAALAVGTQTHFSPNVGKAIKVIDIMKANQTSSSRLVGSNFNNSVVSSSRGAAKPWVNPDSLGQKTVNTTLVTQNGKVAVDNFNSVFGPAASTQNKNIQPW